MRIGVDGREAMRPDPRGIGLYCLHLAREFGRQAPTDEFLYYHQRDVPEPAPELPANVRPVQTDLPGYRLHTWERCAVPWRMTRDKVQVYHGTYNTLPPRWWLLRMPPMVVTLHDVIVTWLDENLDDPYVRYCRKVTGRVVRDAARILTVSEFSRGDIIERFHADPDKVEVCHNGLHPEFLQPADGETVAAVRQHHAGDQDYVFVLGAALERKNTAGAVEAFGRAVAADPDLPHRLLVSGVAGAARERVEAAARTAGVTDRLVILPYLTRSELVAVYAGAALVVYPSLAEGWGIPVLEALSQGTPVATSNTTAMPEAGGEHALYFDPRDPEDMADVIGTGLRNGEGFAAVRDAAIARARTFTWERHVQRLLEVYRDLA